MEILTKRLESLAHRARKRAALFASFTLLTLACASYAEPIYTELFSDKALSGYDTVAFFTENKAVKGKKQYKVEYLNTEWYFSSAKHKALFELDPDKYRPQYGGYCAWAVAANNAKAPGNVKYWTIVDAKLYLNYNQDVQKRWLHDVPGFIATANNNWPALSQE